jgi:tetratricopeptide (TPR) repeat protein
VENQFDDGLAYTNQAIPYLQTTNNIYVVINCHTNRGVHLYMLGRLDEAIESFELAIAMGDINGDSSIRRGMANAYYQIALSQTLAGWPELGLKNAKTSLELANSIGHHHITVTAYLASSLALFFLADYRNSRRDNEAGIEIAKKLQANRMLGYLYTVKAFLESAAGDLGSAYDLSEAIYEIGQLNNHHELQSISHRIKGDIYLLLQAYDLALLEFSLGSELGGQDFWGLDSLVRKGYSQIKLNQEEIGKGNLHRGIDLAKSAGFGMVEIRGLQFLSYAHVSHMEWQLTQELTEQLDRKARIRGLPMVGILAKYIGGVAEHNQKNPEAGIVQLEYLLKMLGYQDQPYITIRILIQIARWKKISNIDSSSEVTRIHEILDQCEKLANPDQIQATFQRYKKQVKSLI